MLSDLLKTLDVMPECDMKDQEPASRVQEDIAAQLHESQARNRSLGE